MTMSNGNPIREFIRRKMLASRSMPRWNSRTFSILFTLSTKLRSCSFTSLGLLARSMAQAVSRSKKMGRLRSPTK